MKYLLRNGKRSPNGTRAWTHPWWSWLQKLENELEHQEQRDTLQEYIVKRKIDRQEDPGLDGSFHINGQPSNHWPHERELKRAHGSPKR